MAILGHPKFAAPHPSLRERRRRGLSQQPARHRSALSTARRLLPGRRVGIQLGANRFRARTECPGAHRTALRPSKRLDVPFTAVATRELGVSRPSTAWPSSNAPSITKNPSSSAATPSITRAALRNSSMAAAMARKLVTYDEDGCAGRAPYCRVQLGESHQERKESHQLQRPLSGRERRGERQNAHRNETDAGRCARQADGVRPDQRTPRIEAVLEHGSRLGIRGAGTGYLIAGNWFSRFHPDLIPADLQDARISPPIR